MLTNFRSGVLKVASHQSLHASFRPCCHAHDVSESIDSNEGMLGSMRGCESIARFITATKIAFRRMGATAAWLLAPYLSWAALASVLNGALWWINRG